MDMPRHPTHWTVTPFLSRFVEPRTRSWRRLLANVPVILLLMLATSTINIPITDACSTRPAPKARPPRPQWNGDDAQKGVSTNCSSDYARLYCLHNGTCQMGLGIMGTTKVAYCICQKGYYGRRCEYLDFYEKHFPSMQKQQFETAAISAAVTVLIILAFFVTIAVYLYRRQAAFMQRQASDSADACAQPVALPFGPRPAVRQIRPTDDTQQTIKAYGDEPTKMAPLAQPEVIDPASIQVHVPRSSSTV